MARSKKKKREREREMREGERRTFFISFSSSSCSIRSWLALCRRFWALSLATSSRSLSFLLFLQTISFCFMIFLRAVTASCGSHAAVSGDLVQGSVPWARAWLPWVTSDEFHITPSHCHSPEVAQPGVLTPLLAPQLLPPDLYSGTHLL